MTTAEYRRNELERIESSGWVANARIRALLAERGLPSPVESLDSYMTHERWQRAESAHHLLRDHFASFRFAEDVEYGILLVPTTGCLDTRGSIDGEVRASQHPHLTADFVDQALPSGVDCTDRAIPWTPFVSVVGEYGISAGSYDDIASSASPFLVDGVDTRQWMTRQLWGSRLLQSPPGRIPDSDYNASWTFTLFPGESLIGDEAVSATVLRSKVRFRKGKANRGIGSARVSPAIRID